MNRTLLPIEFPHTVAWSVTLIAVACLILNSFLPRSPLGGWFIALVTVAVGLHAISLDVLRASDPSALAEWAAAASFVWGVSASLVPSSRTFGVERCGSKGNWSVLSSTASLWFGAVAGVVIAFLLILRLVHVAVESIWCVPWFSAARYGIAPRGLIAPAFLIGSQFVAWISTRDRRLPTSLFWSVAAFTSWYYLLDPALTHTPIGGFVRTPTTVNVTGAWAILLFCGAVMAVFADANRAPTILLGAGRPAPSPASGEGLPENTPTPGARVSTIPFDVRRRFDAREFATTMCASAGALGFALVLPIWFHLLVPISGLEGSSLSSMSRVTFAAGMATIGCYVLLLRVWHGLLADATLWLVTQAVCGVAVLAATSWAAMETTAFVQGMRPGANTSERFPVVFAAIMVGLALTSVWFTWLASIWRPQLDEGRAWTTEGRLIPALGRFAFLDLALALVVGAVLTFWPQQPTVSASDDSLNRVIGGLAAHLLVVLSTLAAARRWRRPTLRILSFVAVGSTAMFLIVRIWPFRSHIG